MQLGIASSKGRIFLTFRDDEDEDLLLGVNEGATYRSGVEISRLSRSWRGFAFLSPLASVGLHFGVKKIFSVQSVKR